MTQSSSCALVNVLDEIYTLALNMFFNALAVNANQLLEKVWFKKWKTDVTFASNDDDMVGYIIQAELPVAELSATETINKTLQLLEEILATQDSTVMPVEMRKQNLTQVRDQNKN